jgi:hypothetical protein
VAQALGLTCETAYAYITCESRVADNVLQSKGPERTEAGGTLEFSARGPAAVESEARRLFAAVTDAVAGDSALSAWWQDRIWQRVAAEDWAIETLPNGASYGVHRSADGSGVTWWLNLSWETASEPTLQPTTEPTAESTAPVTPEEWAAFDEQAREMCLPAKPADLKTMEGPPTPLDQAPTYQAVRVVGTEVLGPDGEPSLFPPTLLGPYPPAYLDFVATTPGEVDLLVCVALRTGESATYHNDDAVPPEATVYHVDTILWMVDATSGERVGRPWVFLGQGFFPRQLDWGSWEDNGTLALLIHAYNAFDTCHRSVAWDILEFLGRNVPGPGCY